MILSTRYVKRTSAHAQRLQLGAVLLARQGAAYGPGLDAQQTQARGRPPASPPTSQSQRSDAMPPF